MSDDVKLEEEWAREKAAKQEAARKPAPKSRKGLIVALVGVAVTAAMVAVVIYAGDGPSKSTSDSADRVRIEIRAMPAAELIVDGKNVGQTPKSLQFPKSSKQIVIEATMYRHFVRRGGAKDQKFVAARKVTLDRDQLIDFNIKNAKLVESEETTPEREQ